MKVEITIPVLNEEETLEHQVKAVLNFFADSGLSKEYDMALVIADNGSNDSTQAIGEQLSSHHDCVKYLRLEQRGVGLALKASWTQSSADIVGYMDLDLATDLKHLPSAINKLSSEDVQVVTGSRLAKGAKVIGRSALRSFTSRVFNLLVQAWFRSSFSDGMCGFKFLKRDCLSRVQDNGAVSDGWFFATELLVVADALGYKVYDLPVEWTDDPNSKVKITKLTIEYLKAMRLLKDELKKKGLA